MNARPTGSDARPRAAPAHPVLPRRRPRHRRHLAGVGTVGVIVKEVDRRRWPSCRCAPPSRCHPRPVLLVAHRWLPGTPFHRRNLVRPLTCGGASWRPTGSASSPFRRAPIGTVLLITFLAPVLIAVAAPILLGERVDRRTVAGLVLGLAGPPWSSVGGRQRHHCRPASSWRSLAAVSYAGLVLLMKPVAGPTAASGWRWSRCRWPPSAHPVHRGDMAAAPAAEDWLLAGARRGADRRLPGDLLQLLARVPGDRGGRAVVPRARRPAWCSVVAAGRALTVGTVAGGITIVVAGVLVLFAPNRPPSRPRRSPVFLGEDLLAWLVLAIGGALRRKRPPPGPPPRRPGRASSSGRPSPAAW